MRRALLPLLLTAATIPSLGLSPRPAAVGAPASGPQAAPANPIVVRKDPRLREVRLEVGCYGIKPPDVNASRRDESTLVGGAYRLTGVSVGIPVMTRTSWCDTDFSKLDARAVLDGRETRLAADRVFAKPAEGVEGLLKFEGVPPTPTLSELRFSAVYQTQRWEVEVDEAAAARATWPREWPQWTRRYLVKELGIDPEDAEILALAQQATPGGPRSASPFIAAKNAVTAVLSRWKSMTGGSSELGPDKTLRGMQFTADGTYGIRVGRGTHVELATTCVAAVRSIGIPSRVVYGLVVNETKGGKSNANFRYICEFYLPDVGWIPFDPVEMRSQGAATRVAPGPVKGFANVSDLEDVVPLAVKPVPEGFQRADRLAAWGWVLGPNSSIETDYAISRIKLLETSRGNGKPSKMPAPVTDQAP